MAWSDTQAAYLAGQQLCTEHRGYDKGNRIPYVEIIHVASSGTCRSGNCSGALSPASRQPHAAGRRMRTDRQVRDRGLRASSDHLRFCATRSSGCRLCRREGSRQPRVLHPREPWQRLHTLDSAQGQLVDVTHADELRLCPAFIRDHKPALCAKRVERCVAVIG